MRWRLRNRTPLERILSKVVDSIGERVYGVEERGTEMKTDEKLDLLNRVCEVLNDMGHHLSPLQREEMVARVTCGGLDGEKKDEVDETEYWAME